MKSSLSPFEKTIDRTGTGSLKWDRFDPEVLPLWVADMDFSAAPEIVEALKQRVDHGVFGYTIAYDSVVQSVLDYLKRVHAYSIERNWIKWLPGLVPALNVTCRAIGSRGDEVLTCTPVYPPFLSSPANQDRKVVTSPLKLQGDSWTFDFDDLESKVTNRTKLFLLCNPHNPVGKTFSADEVKQLGEFCIRHDLIICSDEIHCDLLFSGSSHVVTATLSEEIADRTITLMSPSKTYNLPGLACAYAVISNPKLRADFNRAAAGFITEVNTFGYIGCQAAYNHGEAWRQEMMSTLESNRDYLFDFLSSEIPQIKKWSMQATYLAWLNIEGLKSEFGIESVVDHFRKAGVGLSPGADFGDDRFVRLNFGCPKSTLQEGLERMARSLKS
jgi:cystathionine beta-lyase